MQTRSRCAILVAALLCSLAGGGPPPVFASDSAAAPAAKATKHPNSRSSGHVLMGANTNVIQVLQTALECQRMNLDVIANNLANLGTTAYKATQLGQQDLTVDQPGQATLLKGAQAVLINRVFTQGELRATGNDLDLAIQGSGFFEVQMPDGTLAWTRDGKFRTDAQGRVVTCDGNPLLSFQPVPAGLISIHISQRGEVFYHTTSGTTLFQVQLARFECLDGLDSIGANLFRETVASGAPVRGSPGENGFGTLQQGFLENSNVNLKQEKARLAQAKQVYATTLEALHVAEGMAKK